MAGKLSGKRIMVIEDEYFIASDLQRQLRVEGADVLGPLADVTKGLAMASADDIDAAILDVNLEGADSYPIADALRDRGVPFVFVTGYDGWSMPEAYRDAPRVGKPFQLHNVVNRVAEFFEAAS